jgi:hypothetical protein
MQQSTALDMYWSSLQQTTAAAEALHLVRQPSQSRQVNHQQQQ